MRKIWPVFKILLNRFGNVAQLITSPIFPWEQTKHTAARYIFRHFWESSTFVSLFGLYGICWVLKNVYLYRLMSLMCDAVIIYYIHSQRLEWQEFIEVGMYTVLRWACISLPHSPGHSHHRAGRSVCPCTPVPSWTSRTHSHSNTPTHFPRGRGAHSCLNPTSHAPCPGTQTGERIEEGVRRVMIYVCVFVSVSVSEGEGPWDVQIPFFPPTI